MIKNINMETDTFDKLKKDMTWTLNRLIATMQRYGSQKAAMTVKVEVSLKKGVDEGGNEYDAPEIKHRVQSTVQVKDETEGEVEGVYALEKTEEGYALVPVNGQVGIEELL